MSFSAPWTDRFAQRAGRTVVRHEHHQCVLAFADELEVLQQAADVVVGVGEDLVALYEKVRKNSDGIGAAVLRRRRCEGCNLELNQGEINRFTAADEDEVLRCEECRRILIRTARRLNTRALRPFCGHRPRRSAAPARVAV